MSGIANKFFKLLFYIILVSVLFIAAAAGIFLATFDANRYKQDLSELVLEKTGRDLQFFGDVEMTIYPALGMRLGAISLSNAEGFGSQPMIKVNKASVSVDVASLITFSPEVDQLLLDGLEINLQTNARGKTNWDDLVASDDAKTGEAAAAGDAESKPLEISGVFGGINLQNARLLWQDKQAGVEYRVSDLNLTTGTISPDTPFALQLDLALSSADGMAATLDLNGEVELRLGENLVKVGNMDLVVDASGEVFPLGKIRLGFASETVNYRLDSGAIELDGLELSLDESRLNGFLHVSDPSKPALSFSLASEQLDLDALLGTPTVEQMKAAEAPADETAVAASAEDVAIELPMELLRSLELDGKLSLDLVNLQNLKLTNIEVKITGKNGLIDLDPLAMQLYDGSFQGAIRVDARASLPKYRVTKKLAGVQIGKLLTDYLGEDYVSGELNAEVEVSTRGESLNALKKNSQGQMRLAVENGALKGFNLRHAIEGAKAKFNKQPAPAKETLTTDFSALSLSGKIVDGVFSSDDLKLQAPLLRIGGEGQADLGENSVDYTVNAKLVDSVSGQEGGEPDQLKGLLIPVRIKGPFESPKIDVQLDEMLAARTKAEADRKKAELQQELDAKKQSEKDKLKDRLLKKLQ